VAAGQPFSVSLSGGLNKSTNSLELLRTPGVATKLRNFEVSIEGGYRRINGFSVFGGDSAVRPNSSSDIEGIEVYADGAVVVSGDDIFFSQDGTSYLQINKASVDAAGDNFSTFSGRSELSLTSVGQCEFALFEGLSDYGELVITDKSGNNKPFLFKMTGTGSALSSRTYFVSQITISGSKTAKFCTIHDNHLVVAGDPSTPNTIYYSATGDIDNFTGGQAVTLEDKVVGLKSFRKELFIFCQNSIFRLININDNTTVAVVPVTKNVGCVDGQTIQEIAGDLVFLAPDGFRTVAGTARIGDVELGTISQNIQPIINDIVLNKSQFQFSSVVIRTKSQYRMFYSKLTDSTSTSKGIIGVLRPQGFEWSETLGIQAPAIASGFDNNGEEKFYHGDRDGYVYNHNVGNTFNPAGVETAINAEYQSPDYDYGDLGTLKTLEYVKLSIAPESLIQPTLRVRYDYDSLDTPQPQDITLTAVPEPALFGVAIFNSQTFGAAQQPLVRQSLTGSGHSNFFKIFSSDTRAPYTINGIYINYRPAGRQ